MCVVLHLIVLIHFNKGRSLEPSISWCHSYEWRSSCRFSHQCRIQHTAHRQKTIHGHCKAISHFIFPNGDWEIANALINVFSPITPPFYVVAITSHLAPHYGRMSTFWIDDEEIQWSLQARDMHRPTAHTLLDHILAIRHVHIERSFGIDRIDQPAVPSITRIRSTTIAATATAANENALGATGLISRQ